MSLHPFALAVLNRQLGQRGFAPEPGNTQWFATDRWHCADCGAWWDYAVDRCPCRDERDAPGLPDTLSEMRGER